MAKLGLSSPWVILYHEIEAFFKRDKDVRVVYNEDENIICLYVDNAAKADALTQLLPTEKAFGSVITQIKVVPSNTALLQGKGLYAINPTVENLYTNALTGNENFVNVISIDSIFSNPMIFVIFKKEVIQYFNDSLSDINGVCSTLSQEIAKDIFEPKENVFYCTDVKNNLSIKLPLSL